MRVTLVKPKHGSKLDYYLSVQEFRLPKQSRHLLVAQHTWTNIKPELKHEDELTPGKTSLLKVLGKGRTKASEARDIIEDMYPEVNMNKTLVKRVMKKGLADALVAMSQRAWLCLFNDY